MQWISCHAELLHVKKSFALYFFCLSGKKETSDMLLFVMSAPQFQATSERERGWFFVLCFSAPVPDYGPRFCSGFVDLLPANQSWKTSFSSKFLPNVRVIVQVALYLRDFYSESSRIETREWWLESVFRETLHLLLVICYAGCGSLLKFRWFRAIRPET